MLMGVPSAIDPNFFLELHSETLFRILLNNCGSWGNVLKYKKQLEKKTKISQGGSTQLVQHNPSLQMLQDYKLNTLVFPF